MLALAAALLQTGPLSAQMTPNAPASPLLDLIYGNPDQPSLLQYDRDVVGYPQGAQRLEGDDHIVIASFSLGSPLMSFIAEEMNAHNARTWPTLKVVDVIFGHWRISWPDDRFVAVRPAELVEAFGGMGGVPRDHFHQVHVDWPCAFTRRYDNAGNLVGGMIDHEDYLLEPELRRCFRDGVFVVLGLDQAMVERYTDVPVEDDPRFAALALLYGGVIEPGMTRAEAEAVLGLGLGE
ncbi:MAG: hypothetical protein RLO50_20390 [Azospirillaceae bacterium]